MTWNWDLRLIEKFFVNMKYATMKYEIIRKGVEVNSLKSAH